MDKKNLISEKILMEIKRYNSINNYITEQEVPPAPGDETVPPPPGDESALPPAPDGQTDQHQSDCQHLCLDPGTCPPRQA